MSEHTSQVVGLIGFILAGFVFIAVGVRSGDVLTVVGSALWIISCLIWMAPIVRRSSLGRGGDVVDRR